MNTWINGILLNHCWRLLQRRRRPWNSGSEGQVFAFGQMLLRGLFSLHKMIKEKKGWLRQLRIIAIETWTLFGFLAIRTSRRLGPGGSDEADLCAAQISSGTWWSFGRKWPHWFMVAKSHYLLVTLLDSISAPQAVQTSSLITSGFLVIVI